MFPPNLLINEIQLSKLKRSYYLYSMIHLADGKELLGAGQNGRLVPAEGRKEWVVSGNVVAL